jgi:tetratricopeptide (TPR) repeat protein
VAEVPFGSLISGESIKTTRNSTPRSAFRHSVIFDIAIFAKTKNMRILIALVLLAAVTSCKGKKAGTETQVRNLDSLVEIYPDSVPLLIEHGNKLLDSYFYEEALSDGARAFRLDSNNLEARFLYANALNNRQNRTIVDVAVAQRHFKLILENQPGNKKAYISLASTYTQQGDFEKSFRYINEALRIDKRYRDAYIMKGSNYLALGNRKLAKSSYETAVQQDPKFFEGYMALGYIYSEDGDPLAIEYFRTAAELQPKSVDALYGIAYSLQQEGKFDEALAGYRHLIETDTNFYLALFNEGYIKQFEQNQVDSAIYFYRSALDMQPRFVKGWHNLGLCYESQGRRSDALKAFGKALKYNPDFELSREAVKKLQ